MEYRFLKSFKINSDFGSLLSVDISSYADDTDFNNLIEEIMNEIVDSVQRGQFPDYFWIKGISNKKKYSICKDIIGLIKELYPTQKIGMNLNCALFQDENLRNYLYKCDLVAINLNSIELLNFSKINKCPESANPIEILDGIKEFRRNFDGNLGIYILFIRGVNDNTKTLEHLKKYLLELMPDHCSISNYVLNGFKPITDKFKLVLKESLKDLPFKVIYTFN
ncbi:MAG: hypothetical protein ACFE9I_05940 [Candidatus Hermodarchaeota archaeon]